MTWNSYSTELQLIVLKEKMNKMDNVGVGNKLLWSIPWMSVLITGATIDWQLLEGVLFSWLRSWISLVEWIRKQVFEKELIG